MIEFLKDLRKDLIRINGKLEAALRREELKKESENQASFDLEEEAERPPCRNELILKNAIKELGVKEVRGSGNNAQVVKYHRYASKNNKVDQPDSVPWCSSFLCFLMETTYPADSKTENGELKPMGSTNSMLARSWLKWGVDVTDDPVAGDVVVYWRESPQSYKGHCGIFLKKNPDGTIVTLGGNQQDEVNLSTYSDKKLLSIRRSSKSRVLDEADRAVLYVIARGIINGKYINDGGKVS